MKILILIVCVALSFGCATYKPPVKHDFQKTATINKSFNQTWQKLIDWFSENNTPIKTIDKNSGFITTERNVSVSDSRFCDCGELEYGSSFQSALGNLNFTVKVVDSNNTQVTINSFFKCFINMPGYVNLSQREGESTGKLESEIFSSLQN